MKEVQINTQEWETEESLTKMRDIYQVIIKTNISEGDHQ